VSKGHPLSLGGGIRAPSVCVPQHVASEAWPPWDQLQGNALPSWVSAGAEAHSVRDVLQGGTSRRHFGSLPPARARSQKARRSRAPRLTEQGSTSRSLTFCLAERLTTAPLRVPFGAGHVVLAGCALRVPGRDPGPTRGCCGHSGRAWCAASAADTLQALRQAAM